MEEAEELKEIQDFLESFKPGLRKSLVMRNHIEDFRIKNEKDILKIQEKYNLDGDCNLDFKITLMDKKVNTLRNSYYGKINKVKMLHKEIQDFQESMEISGRGDYEGKNAGTTPGGWASNRGGMLGNGECMGLEEEKSKWDGKFDRENHFLKFNKALNNF